MNPILFLSLLAALGGGSLLIGRLTRKVETKTDFFLMGRNLGLFSLVMTLLATQIGGGALLGAAEEAYKHGWVVIFYPLGMVVGMIILGLGFGAKFRSLGLSTVAEIFEKKYDSKRLRKSAALLSIISLFLILIAQAIAARKFFCAIGFGQNYLFVALWMVLIAYTVMGGLKAVVRTDILQACFILVAFACAFLCTTAEPAQMHPQPIPLEGAPWQTWLFMPLFFMLIEQDMGQRCFAAKSARTITFAACFAAITLLIVSLTPIYFGSLAAKSGLVTPEGSSVLVSAVQHFTNPSVSTLLVCAILMAIISTADSLICSISSNIAYDFPGKNNSVRKARLLTFLVGMGALAIAFMFTNVVAMLMFSYELSVALLFIPVIMGLILKKPSKKSAALSMLLGGVTFLLYRDATIPFLYPMLYGLGGFTLMELKERSSKRVKRHQPM